MKLCKTKVTSLLALCFLGCVNQASKKENNTELVEISEALQNSVHVIYHSIDGGNTWTPFDTGIPQDATVSSFLALDDKIFVSTDYNGIYSIKESEREWKRIDDDLPENVDINAISSIGNFLVMGTLHHGIMISGNNGKNWSNPAVQINNTSIRSLYSKENVLFAGADNGIYKSLDNGNTWKHIWKGVQTNGFIAANNKIYAALMNGAAMTEDNGTRWKYIYEHHALHDIATDGESVYAMTLGDGLKKSSNDGLTWENVNSGLGTKKFYTFEVKRFDNTIFAAQWHGLYKSDDGGRNWSIIQNGLPDSTAFMTLETTRSGLIAGIGLRKKIVKR